jgi:hypothetical protein
MLTRMIDRWRLSRGLRWEARRPTLAEAHDDAIGTWQIALTLLLMLVVYGIVGEMDYRDALRAEAERQQTRADLNQAALLACLNGRASGHYYEDSAGNRTYLACRGVDEIPVGRPG